MKYFKLPDLGEGLQEAEIVEWHIKAGDDVKEDQLLLSVETAKAIVDLPAPQAGKVQAIFGDPGDIIHVGEPLLEYAGAESEDSGTVVGEVKSASRGSTAEEEHFIIGSAHREQNDRVPATPLIRALARRLNVDLAQVAASGSHGQITSDDVEKAAQLQHDYGDAKPLRGVQRAMASNMTKAHAEVVKVSIHDDVDIEHWPKGTDITMRLTRAIAAACNAEPGLNAWFDGERMSLRTVARIDLGIAVDTPDGLFVPVLRDIGGRTDKDLRKGLNKLRDAVSARKIPPQEMTGATITLSNFGTMAGRYADPVVVPPMVAILGAGRLRKELVMVDNKVAEHRFMPLSLSFDHRVVRGGEAARFLAAVMAELARP